MRCANCTIGGSLSTYKGTINKKDYVPDGYDPNEAVKSVEVCSQCGLVHVFVDLTRCVFNGNIKAEENK